MVKGIRGKVLRSVTDGRGIYTTAEWVQDFLVEMEQKRRLPVYHFYESPSVAIEKIRKL